MKINLPTVMSACAIQPGPFLHSSTPSSHFIRYNTHIYPVPLPSHGVLLTTQIQIGNILAKTAALCIDLNIDGAPISSRSHTHPSHSQTSRLLTSSL
jgi:hypothetical protein